jgi:hypothetical protein
MAAEGNDPLTKMAISATQLTLFFAIFLRSMKSDLCCEVRAASANRMHSAALLRNWSKLGKSAPLSLCSGGLRTRSVLLHNPFKVAYRRKPELHAFFRSGMPATQ